MIRPGEEGYNKDYDIDDPNRRFLKFDTMTLDQAIEALSSARDIIGGDCILLMSYDGSAGYDCIKSIYAEELHGDLIISMSCVTHEEAKESGKTLGTFASID